MDRETLAEARARVVAVSAYPGQSWGSLGDPARNVCRRVAFAELEREARLTDAIADAVHWTRRGCTSELNDRLSAVLRAYEAEFAPPQRTVEQIFGDETARSAVTDISNALVVSRKWYDELAAALARGK